MFSTHRLLEEGIGYWGLEESCANGTHRRFLRARKFDVNAAWGQFKDTEDWRKDNAIEKLYENIDIDSYESARRMVRPCPHALCQTHSGYRD